MIIRNIFKNNINKVFILFGFCIFFSFFFFGTVSAQNFTIYNCVYGNGCSDPWGYYGTYTCGEGCFMDCNQHCCSSATCDPINDYMYWCGTGYNAGAGGWSVPPWNCTCYEFVNLLVSCWPNSPYYCWDGSSYICANGLPIRCDSCGGFVCAASGGDANAYPCCSGYSSRQDYDGGAFCCGSTQCGHNDSCYNDGTIMDGYKCVSGIWQSTYQWTEIQTCSSGCCSGYTASSTCTGSTCQCCCNTSIIPYAPSINSPATSSIQYPPSFTISVSGDGIAAGGCGPINCFYHVGSVGYPDYWTVGWGSRPCNGSFNVTVGPDQNCRNEGTDTCAVNVFSQDQFGNTNGVVRSFSIKFGYDLTVSKAGSGSGTVISSPIGIDCGATCSASYASGTSVILTAAATATSTFAGWSGGGCSGTSTCTVIMRSATTVTATFNSICSAGENAVIKDIFITGTGVNAIPFYGASVDAMRFQALYLQSEINQVGYIGKVFFQKYDSGGGTFNNFRIYLCHSSLASFIYSAFASNCKDTPVQVMNVPSVALSGNAGDWLEFDVANTFFYNNIDNLIVEIRWNGDSGNYVNINYDTVTPYRREYAFSDTAATGSVNAIAYKFKAAMCVPPLNTLTVTKAGTGSGTASTTDGYINCGPACSSAQYNYASGTSVTLTATPATATSTFAGWSGGGCSGTSTCTVIMRSTTTVTATFNLTMNTLTVTKTGTGSGTVTSSPTGIDCGPACSTASTTYASGTSVILTAAPATATSTFTGWWIVIGGGSCPGTSTCTVTMNSAKTVAADFSYSDFSISATPTSLRAPKVSGTSDASTTLTVTSLGNFNSAVTFSARWCTGTADASCAQSTPTGITPGFGVPSVIPPAGGSASAPLYIDTNNPATGVYYLRVRGTFGSVTRDSAVITLTVVDLSVTLAAVPSSGAAPLNGVDLTADVGGTATGTVNLKFHCNSSTSPATWQHSFIGIDLSATDATSVNRTDNEGTTHSTQRLAGEIFKVIDLCNCTTTGSYTPRVRAERDVANPAEATTTVTVTTAPDFSISPALTSLRSPRISGTSDASTTITVTSINSFNSAVTLSAIWCLSTGDTVCVQLTPSGLTPSFSSNPITPPANGSTTSILYLDTINTPAGTYYLRVRGASSTLIHDTSVITLTVVDLSVTLAAVPSSGAAPLNGVDLTATVSGSAVGTINYKFDCTNDGSFEFQVNNTSTNPLTAIDRCENVYVSAQVYTAKVRAERDVANPAEATTTVTVTSACVYANPTISISPSSQLGTAGTAMIYSVNVINNDSGCGAGLFDLSITTCPSGWSCSLSQTPIFIPSGQTAGSTNITVTAPSGTVPGNYTFTVRAVNGLDAAHYSSGSGTSTITSIVCSPGSNCDTVGQYCCATSTKYICQGGGTVTNTFNSMSQDGFLYAYAPTTTSYATVHDTSTASYMNNTTNYVDFGQEYDASWTIWRAALFFDTNALPANANILSATMTPYIYNNYGGYTINLVSGANLNNPLTLADYGHLLSATTSFGSVSTPLPGFNKPFPIKLNSSGLSQISKAGITKFGIRTTEEINATPPTAWNAGYFWSYEASPTTYKPTLTVTYNYSPTWQNATSCSTGCCISSNPGDSCMGTGCDCCTGCNLNRTGDYMIDFPCVLDGANYLQTGNLSIVTGGSIQMNPSSSFRFNPGKQINLQGNSYVIISATAIINKQ